ncbi:YesL family protein [Arthrobacter sp. ISL-48]|uniref:YesL family protein n=1 Tax=Arthrobacter sp. ISL-48 TaxID=2819110 RepID=UPI001BE7DC03|nr:YesL family protein [Arthrobacter sp. ISL-48]MBT2532973.1 YesL family protein [Arthrobacter sp. ISL-48]
MVQKKTEYGAGPLFRAAGTVSGVMMGSALLVLANVLLVVAAVFVSLSPGMPTSGTMTSGTMQVARSGPGFGAGGLLFLLACVPVGPSLVAAMYAFNRLLSGRDTGVLRDFVRGYRMNFGQAVMVWLPYLLLLVVIAFSLAGLGSIYEAEPLIRLALLVLGLLVGTAALNALLLLSRFAFRVRDIYWLSLYSFVAQKRVSLGNAGILFVTVFLLLTTTAFLLPVIAGAVVYFVGLSSRPLLKHVERKFTLAHASRSD